MIVIFQMFDWISLNRQVFLQDYTRVGDTHAQVIQLQAEHSKFTDNSMVSWDNSMVSWDNSIPRTKYVREIAMV